MLENTSLFFPSRTVEYNIRLVPRSLEVAEDLAEAEATRKAKMEDLLHFVSEITNADMATTTTAAASTGAKPAEKASSN